MAGDLRWCCDSSNNNWDLHAVVRFACSGGSQVTPPSASLDESFSWLPLLQPQKDEQMDAAAWQPLPACPAVEDLCLEAAFAAPKPGMRQPASPRNKAPPQQPRAKPRTSYRNGGGGPTRSKRKKKKSQMGKEVTRVPVGGPPADFWAWRKYGQKPIKGSPYPRGYYRCSSDKECKARKQVERCRTDSTILIVSYTGEHSHPVPLHRNSLAGTTRKKPQPPSFTSPGEELPQPQAAPTDTKMQDSPSASAGLSPTTPLLCPSSAGVEYEDDEKEDAVAAFLLLEDAEMAGEDDVLLFLKAAPDPSNGSGCKDSVLFLEPHEPAPGQGNGGGWEDVMLVSKLHDEHTPTTSRSRTDGGPSQAAKAVMNIADEKFSVSGLSWWEAAAVPAASSWA